MVGFQNSQKHTPFSKGWLMLLAFVVGLVYLLMLPPWQQNDEPGQFEYAWLAANLNHWPQPGDVDSQMRREVIVSMVEHGFYRGRDQQANLALQTEPANIGIPQLDGQPLYYLLASLPLRLFRYADVTLQLYLARFVSLMLFVATVFFAIQTTDLLFGNHLLGWMIAVFIAMLPQLAYRMTAVNDDAGAVAAMTFFIWMSVRGIKNGADWKTILGIPAGAVLCFLSKSTAWLAIPFSVLALLLSIFHARPRLVWAGVFGLTLMVVLFAFEWCADLPANFYQYYSISRRVQSQQVIDGKYTFMTNRQHDGFYQVLDKDTLTTRTKMTDRKVTVGVWAWSNQPVDAPFLQLQFNGNDVLKVGNVTFSEQPVFITAQTQIPEDYRAPVLRVLTNNLPAGVEVYWDCFVLVPGERNNQSQPQTSENCNQVEWDGYSGGNLIRNPSAERGWFPLREKVAAIINRFYLYHQVTDFWAVFDPPTSWVYFKEAPAKLFRTFWGRFNSGTLALVGSKPYRPFAVLSVLALIGNGIAFWRYRKNANWNQVQFLLLLLVVDFLYTISRFTGNWNNYYNFLPQARYFFPVILPTAFFICMGWYTLLEAPLKLTHLKDKFVYIMVGVFLLYNGWAWYTIWAYWY